MKKEGILDDIWWFKFVRVMKNLALLLFLSFCTSIFATPKLRTVGKVLKGTGVAGDSSTAAEIFSINLILEE